jgi:hypothetical protein
VTPSFNSMLMAYKRHYNKHVEPEIRKRAAGLSRGQRVRAKRHRAACARAAIQGARERAARYWARRRRREARGRVSTPMP